MRSINSSDKDTRRTDVIWVKEAVVVKVRQTESLQIVEVSVFGDKSEAELSNAATQVNTFVVSFNDHLKGWARRNGPSPDALSFSVDASLEESPAAPEADLRRAFHR